MLKNIILWQARDLEDQRDHNRSERSSRARSNSGRQMVGKGNTAPPDMDARHKVASLSAQLMQKDHRIRGLEQGVATKLAEASNVFLVCSCIAMWCCTVRQ